MTAPRWDRLLADQEHATRQLREHLEELEDRDAEIREILVRLALPFAWRARRADNPIDEDHHTQDLGAVAGVAERLLGKGAADRLLELVQDEIDEAEALGEAGPEAAARGGR